MSRDLDELAEQAQQAADAEFFETPDWCVEALLAGGGPELPGGTWIDPCAGRGRIQRAVNRLRHDIEWHLVELRAECAPELEALMSQSPGRIGSFEIDDFLRLPELCPIALDDPRVIIMNSPFSLTVRFVEQSWRLAPRAWVVSLQRQSWVGPARRAWLLEHMPHRYGLPQRPSFRRDGQTDGCEYEWHVWPPEGRNLRDAPGRMLTMPGQLRLL